MAVTVGFAPVGSFLRDFWVSIAQSLVHRGDEVYFFDPNPILSRHLRQEGLEETIIRFNYDRTKNPPLTEEQNIHIVDHILRNFNKKYETIQSEYAEFCHHLKQLDIDILLFWNDYRSVGVIAADQCGTSCLFMENGYLEDTIQINEGGVNRNSTIAKCSESQIIRSQPEYEIAKEAHIPEVQPLSKVDLGIGFGQKALTDPQAALRSISHRIPNVKAMIPGGSRDFSLPNSFIFAPLQVHDDTQIKYNSPIVNDMRTFLTTIQYATNSVAPKRSVVVKEHPADQGRISYDRLRSQFPSVHWLKNYAIDELISKADVVTTINSSVGFQALAKGTPVVTLGLSLYDPAPNVWSVQKLDEVPSAINAALDSEVDQERVDRYINSVIDMAFISGTPTSFTDETIRHVLGYINSLTS